MQPRKLRLIMTDNRRPIEIKNDIAVVLKCPTSEQWMRPKNSWATIRSLHSPLIPRLNPLLISGTKLNISRKMIAKIFQDNGRIESSAELGFRFWPGNF